jgi:hypothetical protein
LAASTAEILNDRGYGTTATVELRSNGGDALNKLKTDKIDQPADYTVMTEQGIIYDGQNKKIEMNSSSQISLPLKNSTTPGLLVNP